MIVHVGTCTCTRTVLAVEQTLQKAVDSVRVANSTFSKALSSADALNIDTQVRARDVT